MSINIAVFQKLAIFSVMESAEPYSFEKDRDNDREAVLKRRDGVIVSEMTSIPNKQFFFMNERNAPVGVNYGFDRLVNLFRFDREDYDQRLTERVSGQCATLVKEMEKRHRDEVKALKQKIKDEKKKRSCISKSNMKWLLDKVEKATKQEDTIIECERRYDEIRRECQANNIRWSDEATSVMAKQRKAEDELMYVLNALKGELPKFREMLEGKKEK